MRINIKVFKPSGKFYADETVENDVEIPLFKEEFKKFVIDNLPARYSGGYVVVSNVDEDSNEFYEVLFKYDELVGGMYNVVD